MQVTVTIVNLPLISVRGMKLPVRQYLSRSMLFDDIKVAFLDSFRA